MLEVSCETTQYLTNLQLKWIKYAQSDLKVKPILCSLIYFEIYLKAAPTFMLL